MLLHRTKLFVIITVLILSFPIITISVSHNSGKKALSFDSVDLDGERVYSNEQTTARTGPDHHWPMLGRDMYHSHFQPISTRGIGDVKVKWDNQQDVLSWATLAGDFSANIYGPAPEDRQHVVYATSTEVHIVDGATGDDMWVLDIDGLNISSVGDVAGAAPAIADFDKNGKVEIVFVTDNNLQNEGVLYVFEPNITYNATGYHWDAENNGVSERKFEYAHEGNTIESSPVLGDINNDGREDAVLTMGMNIIALDIYNQEIIYEYDKLDGNKVSTPALFHYTPTDLRCVINTRDGGQFNTYMVDHNGDTAWNESIPISSVTSNGPVTFLPSPAVDEINLIQDGLEIVILTPFEEGDGRVRVYSKDGDEMWSMPFQAEGQFDSSPVLLNADGDSMKEIGVVSWKAVLLPEPHIESHAYLLDNSGSELWSYVKNESASIEGTVASPVAGLVSDDDVPDMVIATTSTVIALNGVDGKPLWDIAPGSGVLSSSPAVGEFDNDDFLDIALEGFVLSNREVDLTLNTSDISFTDATIYDGVEVGIVAMIRNLGEDEARDVDVRFYETTGENIRLIGNTTIDSIPEGDTRQSTVDWTPLDKGETEITVSIDFNNTIPETDEDNNRKSIMVNVHESMADLEIVNVDLKRHDGVKTDNDVHLVDGEESYINITITNSGLKNAPTCSLLIKLDSSVLIDRNDLGSVAPGERVFREIPHRFQEGTSTLNITLDPDDVVREENDTNNYYEIPLTVIDDDPGDAPYLIEGHVYTSDVTIASGAEIRALNNETVEQMIVFADSNGAYSLDVSDIRGGYHEGDEIKIFASHGNESKTTSIFVYSEDKGIVKNIILLPGTSHDFDMKFSGAHDIAGPPGKSYSFRFMVTNRGDGDNKIEFEEIGLMDANTSLALNWDALLSVESVQFSSNGESRDVTLTITVPPEAAIGMTAEFTVTAYSEEERNMKRDLTGSITIAVEAAFNLSAEVVAESVMVSDEETVVYFHYDVENTGSAEDSYSVAVTVYPDDLDVTYAKNYTLKAKEITTKNVTVEVPAETEPDTYLIQVDVTSESTGSVKNLVFAVQVGNPELAIDTGDISITPVKPQLGGEITVSCRITNNGTFDSGAFQVKMTEENTGEVTAQQRTAVSIPGSSFGIISFKVNLTVYGLYGFHIKIDPDGELLEMNREDNAAEKSLDLRPDLVIDNALITVSTVSGDNLTNVIKGDVVYLKIEISNPGDVDVDMAFTVTAYSSADKNAEVFGTLAVDEVIPGGDTATVTVRAALANADVGEQAIVVKLDTDDNITEVNEDNNMVRLTVTVAKPEGTTGGLSSMEKGLAFIGIFAVLVIIALLVRKKRSGRDSEYYNDLDNEDEVNVVAVEDDDDGLIVEPMAVEAVEAVEEKGGEKKKKRSLQELLSKLEKTTDDSEKKVKKTEGTPADEDMEMDISDIIEMAKETDLDREISEMLDMDEGGEGTDGEEEDFIGKLRGEMGGMRF